MFADAFWIAWWLFMIVINANTARKLYLIYKMHQETKRIRASMTKFDAHFITSEAIGKTPEEIICLIGAILEASRRLFVVGWQVKNQEDIDKKVATMSKVDREIVSELTSFLGLMQRLIEAELDRRQFAEPKPDEARTH